MQDLGEQLINEDTLTEIQNAVKDSQTVDAELSKIWKSLDSSPILFIETDYNDTYMTGSGAFSPVYPEFPMKTEGKFDLSKL